jgi:hypothetical protein
MSIANNMTNAIDIPAVDRDDAFAASLNCTDVRSLKNNNVTYSCCNMINYLWAFGWIGRETKACTNDDHTLYRLTTSGAGMYDSNNDSTRWRLNELGSKA